MEIKEQKVTVGEVYEGYFNDDEEGVVGYGGRLDIRPKYQREFVYKDKQRDAVLETVIKGFPLNVMYWAETDDGNFELLDGQQRTVSICQYVHGDFSLNSKYFHNLTQPEKDKILNYDLTVYICKGDEKEKLDWFKTINIASVQLKNQELRNAVYTGPWLTDAKRYFSKNGCVAYLKGGKYLNGEVNRQDYLETVLSWISAKQGISIEDYMAIHQHDTHATPLWQYFQNVIDWIEAIFPTYRKEMKGLSWGLYYNKHSISPLSPYDLEGEIVRLMQDDEVQHRAGIYEYLLTGDRKFLNLRTFTDNQKRMVYEKQGGFCPECIKQGCKSVHYTIEEMEADHIKPWSKGGKTTIDNCQLLCKKHNREKSDKY